MNRRPAGKGPDPRQLKEKLQRIAQTRARSGMSPAHQGKADPTAAVARPSAAGDAYAFVAYPHADDAVAEALVDALKARGIVVKWDKDLLGGDNFRRRLDELLNGAAAVIVIWSPNVTDFVIDEADAGKANGTLVTCRVRDLPPSRIPTGFRGLHCIDVDDIDAILRALGRRGLTAQAA